MSYELDTQQARKADQRGAFINDTGKYVGKIIRAEEIIANSGTKGIDFSFKTDGGQQARFALYTEKGDGSRISIGHAFVMALMTCLKVRSISPSQMRVKKWDTAAGAEVDASAPCFADLMNKDIGVLLEAEEYAKNNGETGKRMVLAGVFQAGTELTASEVLDKKTAPEQLPKMVSMLRDRPLKAARPPARSSAPQPRSGGASFDDMDDDIPF
ncbi:MAG: hypothetical protein Q7T97_02320 [Burkholderiaceae bacterium]|nr:hypothetical protein [Burkholderiaceae bacterium]